jgi:hypothetical protein
MNHTVAIDINFLHSSEEKSTYLCHLSIYKYHLTFFMILSYLPPFFPHLQRLSVPIKIKHIAPQKNHEEHHMARGNELRVNYHMVSYFAREQGKET